MRDGLNEEQRRFLAWCAYHVLTEEYDRTLPGVLAFRNDEAWIVEPGHRADSIRNAANVLRQCEEKYQIAMHVGDAANKAVLTLTDSERRMFVQRGEAP